MLMCMGTTLNIDDGILKRAATDANLELVIFGPLAVTTELPVCTPEEANPLRRWQDQS